MTERPNPAIATSASHIQSLVKELEQAALEQRWPQCDRIARELLGVVSKVLARVKVLAELQADGSI